MGGKSTIAQTIALSMNGRKEFTPGMITRGEEKAEIIAYMDAGLKIRTVIENDDVKQTVQRLDSTLQRYVNVSGGVRAFLNSLCSGLETPWALRDMSDAKIIELLKNRCGVDWKIADIDIKIKEKMVLRTEVGRDRTKMGNPDAREPDEEDKIKHPDSIDGLKTERRTAAEQIAWRKAQFDAAVERLRSRCVFNTLEQLEEYKAVVGESINVMKVCLANREVREKKIYTQVDIDALDKRLSAWVDLEQKASAFEKWVAEKEEWDGLGAEYDRLTVEIETLREDRKNVLREMKLGVKGLEIGEDNNLYHNGVVRGITEVQRSSNWSTAESVQVFFGLGARFTGD
jgi:hypothetical protein